MPVMLLHGGGQTRHAWGKAAAALARVGCRAYSLDLRGHGDSAWSADGNYALEAYCDDLRGVVAALRIAGEYERIDEDHWSNLDMEIHEHPILAGSIGVIRTRIDHRDDRGLAHWKGRHAEYAAWEARRALKLRADGNAPTVGRQATKYRVLDRRWLPAAYFLDGYVRRGGFLDGWPGLCHAWLKARYFAEIGRMLRRGV